MNRLIQLNKATAVFFIVLGLTCFCLSPLAHALNPPPDGCYERQNTAEGCSALASLTYGNANTAIGYFALWLDSTGSHNTAIGSEALKKNIFGRGNTATGVEALLSNTEGNNNTANGAAALTSNTGGASNTAIGFSALHGNTTGPNNTASGFKALYSNTTGYNNTASGYEALSSNTIAQGNTAYGFSALPNNTTGQFNVALGFEAGRNATTGDGNVYIGTRILGVAGESNACYIASIFGQTSAAGVPVLINSDNKLGTATSSKRFKEDIKPMDKSSEALFALKPVAFRYKKEIDPTGISQLGLVAEDVEKVNPDLVVRDKEGKPYSVRYDQVNAMLLNEFLKEHNAFVEEKGKVKELQAMIAQQQKQIETLTAGLQKVSAQLEVSKAAPQTALNNR